jgi:hypothetical protein
MNGVIVLTLAALAASMLHNRVRDETGSSQFQIQLDKWLGDEAVKVLNGAEISRELAEARRATNNWEFKGGTGAYTRAVTLPEMAFADVAALIEKALHSPNPYVGSSSK